MCGAASLEVVSRRMQPEVEQERPARLLGRDDFGITASEMLAKLQQGPRKLAV